MERKIKIEDISDNLIILNGVLMFYNLHSGYISTSFNIKKLLLEDHYYKKVIENGYKYYRKKIRTVNDSPKVFYIPISKNFIEFYQLNWNNESLKKGFITLCNKDLNNNVDAFYEFSLEVEISGLRTKFTQSLIDNYHIYIEKPYNNKALEEKMTTILGAPQVPSDIGYDKYEPHYYYIVPTDKLDKIIGIKRYRDTSTFGKADGEKFTGEVEEIILDLHNFDENIYKIFKEHGMVEIEKD